MTASARRPAPLRLLLALLILLPALAPMAEAATAPPVLLTAQGRLVEGGVPVTGTRTMTFAIVNPDSSVAWSSGPLSLPVTDGLYAVLLGNTTAGQSAIPSTVLATSGLSLQVSDGSATLTPNVAIVPAMQANFAFAVADGSVTATSLAPGAVSDAAVTNVAWSKITSTPTTIAGYGITNAVAQGAGGPTTMSSGTAAPTGGSPGDLYVQQGANAGAVLQNVAGVWQAVVQAPQLQVVTLSGTSVNILSSYANSSVVVLCGSLDSSSATTVTFPLAASFPAGAAVRLRFAKTSLTSPSVSYVLNNGDQLTLDAGIYQAPSSSSALTSTANVLPMSIAFASDGVSNWYQIP